MTTVLKYGADKQSIRSILKKLGERQPRKAIDAHKYCGTVNFKEDGLAFQKRLRDEGH